jgi:hypothetical protein
MVEKGLIGVQMSTIAPAKMPKFDAFESMKKLTDIGYHCIEISQVPMTAENVAGFRRAIDELGMNVSSCTAAVAPMAPGMPGEFLSVPEDFKKIVADCRALDCDMLRIGMLPMNCVGSYEKAVNFAKQAEELSLKLKEEGIDLYYHNHHVEFVKYNGEYLDLHCGGIDNAFPHHTNEIAQSEAYIGHPWCRQWFHVHHLNTNSGKMSKSKGEFLTVSLLEEKGYDPIVYRFFCLQSHYRKGLVFSWENLDNATVAFQKLIAKIAALDPADGPVDEGVAAEYREKFRSQVGNDLNTALAVTALYDALKAKTNGATRLAILDSFDQVLSLSLLDKAAAVREEQKKQKTASQGGYTITGEGAPAVDAQVMARYEAKKAKNFAEADRIRDELKAQGIEVTDLPGGASWKRV